MESILVSSFITKRWIFVKIKEMILKGVADVFICRRKNQEGCGKRRI